MPDNIDIPTTVSLAPMVDIDPNAWPVRFAYGTVRQMLPPGATNPRGIAVASAVVDLADDETVIEEHDYADYAKRFSPRADSHVRRAEQAAINRVNELNRLHSTTYQQPLEVAMLLEANRYYDAPERLHALAWTYLPLPSGRFEVLQDDGERVMQAGQPVTLPDKPAKAVCATFHRQLLTRRYREMTARV